MINCRACLKNLNDLVLLDQDHKKKFLHITGIDLDEAAEDFLCKKCLKLLIHSWQFRIEAINADDWFRKQTKSSEKETECHEEQLDPVVKCELFEDLIVEAIPLEIEEEVRSADEDYYYICDLCKEKFTSHRKIRDHMSQHRKKLGLYCRLCDSIFPNRSAMRKHEKSHFIVKSSIVCEQCGKALSDFRQLRMHMRTHANTYKCTFPGCFDTFTRKRAYYNHFGVKHGIKPSVCADCGKEFSNHLTLKNHRRIFHNDGIKFTCPECPKTCLDMRMLEKHIVRKLDLKSLK